MLGRQAPKSFHTNRVRLALASRVAPAGTTLAIPFLRLAGRQRNDPAPLGNSLVQLASKISSRAKTCLIGSVWTLYRVRLVIDRSKGSYELFGAGKKAIPARR